MYQYAIYQDPTDGVFIIDLCSYWIIMQIVKRIEDPRALYTHR